MYMCIYIYKYIYIYTSTENDERGLSARQADVLADEVNLELERQPACFAAPLAEMAGEGRVLI